MVVHGSASSTANALLGHDRVGEGPNHVVVMNDWLCDTSTWDGARGYLDRARFTFELVDLRGYGRSRGRTGAFELEEAASDVLALADALSWSRFSIVGHSMSTLVALHLAQRSPERIERAVVITPPPPTGFGADDAALDASRALALADAPTQLAFFTARMGARLSPGWTAFKAARWRETADPAAAAGYVAMFARDGLRDRETHIRVPVLAITGEQDAPPMRSDAVTRALTPLCDELSVVPLVDSGHYPMQEMAPLTVAIVERFLGGGASPSAS